MVGPVFAYALSQTVQSDDDGAADAAATPSELAQIAGIYLAMEELVDMLGLVVLARFNIYALRVRPHLGVQVRHQQGRLCVRQRRGRAWPESSYHTSRSIIIIIEPYMDY